MPEGGTYCKPALLSHSRPSGHRSKGCWPELSTPLCLLALHTHTEAHKYPCTSGQARIAARINTHSSNNGHSCVCSCLDWSGELSILALIVLFYALAQGSSRAWVDEDACMKRWQRAFSGRTRRWRASSHWPPHFHFVWSGHGLLLLRHSG